jgi:6-pyruvoyltetrahydropterin/6-carboxytetrahydropterin synthase
MMFITRKEHFNAAHKLYNSAWSAERNEAVFGKCANPNYHGHNYDLYVTVKGMPDPETGFIINVFELSEVIRRQVIDKVDHRNLNLDVDFMRNVLASTENFAKAIWEQLEPHIKGCKLHCVKLQETDTIYAEYFGA